MIENILLIAKVKKITNIEKLKTTKKITNIAKEKLTKFNQHGETENYKCNQHKCINKINYFFSNTFLLLLLCFAKEVFYNRRTIGTVTEEAIHLVHTYTAMKTGF